MADSDHSITPGEPPAFQFYPKDFLGDGDQAGMSLQEAGAYIRLMCFEWNAHGNGIPDASDRCARMIGAQPGAMKKMWGAIRPLFIEHPTDAARLVHPRLQKERDKQAKYRRRQSDAAAKRWDKPQASHGNATASERHMPEASSSLSDLQSSSPVRTLRVHSR